MKIPGLDAIRRLFGASGSKGASSEEPPEPTLPPDFIDRITRSIQEKKITVGMPAPKRVTKPPAPEAKKPEEKKPEEKKPEVKQPEVKKPEEKKPEEKPADDKKAEEKKPEEKPADDKKVEEKKPEAKQPEVKQPEAKKAEEKPAEEQKPEVKKPEEKKPEAKQPEEKKPEEKSAEVKQPEETKPEEKKPEEKPVEEKPVEEKPLEPKKPVDPVAAHIEGWRDELEDLAGTSPLVDIARLDSARIDISHAHPSGVAQLFAGRSARLSNLIREGGALAIARRQAHQVKTAIDDLGRRFGVPPAYLAIGVAQWEHDAEDDTHGIPVLLRPVRLEPRDSSGTDYDITFGDGLEVNPVLMRALKDRGLDVDSAKLTGPAFSGPGFDPAPVLNELTELGKSVSPTFSIENRLLIGTFINPGRYLVDDLDEHRDRIGEIGLVRALCGDEEAIAALNVKLPDRVTGDLDPSQDVGIGDLEPDQVRILRAVASGAHLLVNAPPGADVTGTIAAIIAESVKNGRTVLHVAAHRRNTDTLCEAMSQFGIDELVLDTYPKPSQDDVTSPVGRSLLTGLAAAGNSEVRPDPAEIHAALRLELVELRSTLAGYVSALHTIRPPWNVSAYQALQELAALSAATPAPLTTVRLDPEVVTTMDRWRRREMRERLEALWDHGGFDPASDENAWKGVPVTDRLTADRALILTDRFVEKDLGAIRKTIADTDSLVGVRQAKSMSQWGQQLDMFAKIRSTLDMFTPEIFSAPISELVAATATRNWREEKGIVMSGSDRRRFRHQVQDYIRPGMSVGSLHERLVAAQIAQEAWEEYAPVSSSPSAPTTLDALNDEYESLLADFQELDQILGVQEGGPSLITTGFDRLEDKLSAMRRDRAALKDLPDRNRLETTLISSGLGDLLADCRQRRVSREVLGAELELSWWSSVFDSIMSEVPQLAGYDGEALADLVERYRRVDLQHLSTLDEVVLKAVDDHRRYVIESSGSSADSLLAELLEGPVASLRDLLIRYGPLLQWIRPCWLVSPLLVAQTLPPDRTVDLAIIDAEQDIPTAQIISSLIRSRQVVIVGDPQRSRGGLVSQASGILPELPIQATSSRRDPRLTMFFSEHGYENTLTPIPVPELRGLLEFNPLDGTGMPAPGNETVESIPMEVEAVVERVLDHALSSPEESLAVVTVSPLHAKNVAEAIADEVRRNPSLISFFSPDNVQPFTVVDVSECNGLVRDTIIFSLGYAKTPHGRVIHRFGGISEPGGDYLMRSALSTVDHRLIVVSCLTPADLDPQRMKTPGASMLYDFLTLMEAGKTFEPELTRPDPLLIDLARRLWRQGVDVIPNLSFPGGPKIPLAVQHPEFPDRMLIAILTDDDSYVAESSVRVRSRQNADRLARRGWAVMHEWTSALFIDPQGETRAVVDATVEQRNQLHESRRSYATGSARPKGAGTGLSIRGRVEKPVVVQQPAPTPEPQPEAVVVPSRPAIASGKPITSHSPEILVELVEWIAAKDPGISDERLTRQMREELGVKRRRARSENVIAAAIATWKEKMDKETSDPDPETPKGDRHRAVRPGDSSSQDQVYETRDDRPSDGLNSRDREILDERPPHW